MIPFVIRSVRNLLQPKSLRRGFRLRVMGLTAIGIYLSWFVMSSSFRRKKYFGGGRSLKSRLDVELDFITDFLAWDPASRVAQLTRN